jgi:LysR family transcriptional regulator, glycine cleavage system transcriptional activator
LEKYAQPIQRAAGVLRYPLIHFDWTNRDPEAPTWVRRITTARSVDPDVPGIDRAWELSFREELHAVDAVVAVQGMAICSDTVVSRELRSGALVKAQ